MEQLYLECNSGISGDMVVAALLDLGADEKKLREALATLPVEGFEIEIKRTKKSGLDACDFQVILQENYENHDHDMEYLYGHNREAVREHHHGDGHSNEDGHYHGEEHSHEINEDGHAHRHEHEHHHGHTHRSFSDIVEILNQAQLSEHARELALRIFRILGEAEAKAHGSDLEHVHFHEVGAVDSIVDITAAAVCLDNLGISEVIIPGLYEGSGNIRCQHGILPIPVPAVANIASSHGLKLHMSGAKGEYVTPTGAAIAAAIRTSDRLPEKFCVKKIGLGAGKREQELSGILRAMLIQEALPSEPETDEIYKLESNIDDCSGEALGYVMQRLLDAGARDVHYTPIFMKKNRPAYLLTALCRQEDISVMEHIIFLETTTIGIRRTAMKRSTLKRRQELVETSLGRVAVKVVELPTDSGEGQNEASAAERYYPEYDSIAQLCKIHGKSYQEMYQKVLSDIASDKQR